MGPLLVTYALGFKARVSSLGSQYGNRADLFHIATCRPWWELESGPYHVADERSTDGEMPARLPVTFD